MLGVYSSREAYQLAQDKGLDLIEIAPNAKPPTCRIMDYGKWKYENKKKQTAARKKQTVISIKEVQLRPRTDEHDLNVKLKHARRFLMDGDKVKVNLRFSGREMAHQELGYELLMKVKGLLEDVGNCEADPKKEGRQMFIMMAPDTDKIKDYKKKQEAEKSETESPATPEA
jgi:translation initiation factor IF-3